jgi:hypothetical protein
MTSVWIAETPDIRGPRRPLVANLDLIRFKSFEKGCGSAKAWKYIVVSLWYGNARINFNTNWTD